MAKLREIAGKRSAEERRLRPGPQQSGLLVVFCGIEHGLAQVSRIAEPDAQLARNPRRVEGNEACCHRCHGTLESVPLLRRPSLK